MSRKNPKLKISITEKRSAEAKTGCGFLDWGRLEQRLRDCGELQHDDVLEKIYVSTEGIDYVTGKQ